MELSASDPNGPFVSGRHRAPRLKHGHRRWPISEWPLLPVICLRTSGQLLAEGEGGVSVSVSHVQGIIGLMESESSGKKRIEYAQSLASRAAGPVQRSVSDGDIEAMEALMRDQDDAIRLWIAGALGRLFPVRSGPCLVWPRPLSTGPVRLTRQIT